MAGHGILVSILFISLSLPGLESEICSVDEAEQPLVTYLLQRMVRSFDPAATPNPSILLALRLAKDHNLETEHSMVLRLKEEAVQLVKNNRTNSSDDVSQGWAAGADDRNKFPINGGQREQKGKQRRPTHGRKEDYKNGSDDVSQGWAAGGRKRIPNKGGQGDPQGKQRCPPHGRKEGQTFTSGNVALYVMALQASCQNPREVSALNSTIDLVQILQEKYQEELQNIDENKRPLTNYYQLGLDILALCLQDIPVNVSAVLDPGCTCGKFSYGSVFSVDTAAVVVLGLACVKSRGTLTPEETIKVDETLRCLVKKILENKQNDGVIGNIYSTGLAMQALFLSQSYYNQSEWNCSQTLAAAVGAISQARFDNPQAASQITPSLEGRTYLNARGLDCAADNDTLPMYSTPAPPPSSNLSEITVSYTVSDGLTHTFNNSITISVPEGSTFLVVMEKAQELKPEEFSFKVEDSSWGPFLVSINNLAGNNNERTYWQLLNGTTPLQQGVGDYKPSNGEKLVANFTTY